MKRETEGQLSFADYSLTEVRVRLKLTEGETLYSTKPIDCRMLQPSLWPGCSQRWTGSTVALSTLTTTSGQSRSISCPSVESIRRWCL
jgi:hypothetical protein